MGMLREVVQARRRTPHGPTASLAHLGALGLFFLAILDSSPLPTFGGPDILIVVLVVTGRSPWYECVAAASIGSVVGAYITFKLARRAGRAYLDGKFGRHKIPKALKFFEKWETGALVASTAIPFPFPTSLFFAAAGASNDYRTRKFVSVVALSRVVRYSLVALIAHYYGRRVIRVLRHPIQHWGWSLLGIAIFVAVVITGVLMHRGLAVNDTRERLQAAPHGPGR